MIGFLESRRAGSRGPGAGEGGDGAFSLTRRLQTVGRAGPGGTNARVLRATGQCAKAVKTVQRTWTDVSPDDRQAHEKMLSIAVIRKQAGRIAPSRTAATPTRGVGRPRGAGSRAAAPGGGLAGPQRVDCGTTQRPSSATPGTHPRDMHMCPRGLTGMSTAARGGNDHCPPGGPSARQGLEASCPTPTAERHPCGIQDGQPQATCVRPQSEQREGPGSASPSGRAGAERPGPELRTGTIAALLPGVCWRFGSNRRKNSPEEKPEQSTPGRARRGG